MSEGVMYKRIFEEWSQRGDPQFLLKGIVLGADNETAMLASPTRTVAAVTRPFVARATLHLVVLVWGVLAAIAMKRRLDDTALGLGPVDLGMTRRSVSMSRLTEYNCEMMPRFPPTTSIVATGDMTIDLDTSYDPLFT